MMNTPAQATTITASIQSVVLLTSDIYDITLKADSALAFEAGQYLEIILPDGTQSPFTIASAPSLLPEIHLHIQCNDFNDSAKKIMKHLQTQASVSIKLPMGICALTADIQKQLHDDPKKELILIASRTGFAQMKAILEHMFHHDLSNPITLYWAAPSADDFYYAHHVNAWQIQHAHFSLHQVITPSIDLHQFVLADKHLFASATVFACGSPDMVWHAHDAFVKKGMPSKAMHSDVFAFAPRKS